jgi:RNA-binding protein
MPFWKDINNSMSSLSNAQIRELKARAQLLKTYVKVGKAGLSPEFLRSVDESFRHQDLLKVKFTEFKEERRQLAPELAEKTGSELVTLIGNVAVLYRRKAEPVTEV